MNQPQDQPPFGARMPLTGKLQHLGQETEKLMKALADKYGGGTAAAALHLANFRNVIAAAFHPENTKLNAEARAQALKAANVAIDAMMHQMAPAIGCCCHEHLEACATSIMEHAQRINDEIRGREDLVSAEGEAKQVIARAATART